MKVLEFLNVLVSVCDESYSDGGLVLFAYVIGLGICAYFNLMFWFSFALYPPIYIFMIIAINIPRAKMQYKLNIRNNAIQSIESMLNMENKSRW